MRAVGYFGNGPETMERRNSVLESYSFMYSCSRKLMLKPTSHCTYAETKKLFQDIRGWPNFSSVFYTSALTGEGVDEMRKFLMSQAENKVSLPLKCSSGSLIAS